jgi:hypothetical protein
MSKETPREGVDDGGGGISCLPLTVDDMSGRVGEEGGSLVEIEADAVIDAVFAVGGVPARDAAANAKLGSAFCDDTAGAEVLSDGTA